MSATTTYAQALRPAALANVKERRQKPLPKWIRLVRELDPAHGEPVLIRSPQDVQRLLHVRASQELGEVLYLITLNVQAAVVGLHEVTRGTLTSSLVHPREVFIRAIADCAAGIIVAHNHPSAHPTPSHADRAITRELGAAGDVLRPSRPRLRPSLGRATTPLARLLARHVRTREPAVSGAGRLRPDGYAQKRVLRGLSGPVRRGPGRYA